MIVGLGNDIVDISRVQVDLAKRILTPREKGNKNRITEQYVAGRFALKESYFKALGTGLNGNSFQDISFLNRNDGSLYCVIHRYRHAKHGAYNYIHTTLSHDKFAVAEIILEKVEGKVFVGIGTNLGDRKKNIQEAIERIGKVASVISTSDVIETEPYGKTDQPNFLNCVIEISTALSPEELLDALLNIEKEMGRVRNEKWGPRIIDLDILFYGNIIVESEKLRIPHYDFENRIFFVKPMAQIAPDYIHPISLRKVTEILESLEKWNVE
ncbi:MAG: 2-amino-4-hydroxy-6-hydroxymethyldihydropteridine diphosphokinase [Fervidobacterium sp.]|uniref:2-amino-4-hydroxy-6-hydroxymethyldihydropteridine diphosphokinase n=1 Tax=Fervidobacterium gondwanense DSM 13020 TaxID=1121883 RepID=A0A1M7RW85_FERGO|nr:2-amino-4-hydroxy-6-hydroxymethyldihydropteridine diphosphokinase [Fervidobacterium gondwanense]UXF00055.1 7,8-dihydro-6-hydroxymethylpterin-pyrophosphokinase [Fervidobacterium riparium]SHN50627.1 2-amino-4-hydroxy-6-hydroxymethyldihydropteridinediphosphokinase [Fervidobacterium gondwanense DSM 13020]